MNWFVFEPGYMEITIPMDALFLWVVSFYLTWFVVVGVVRFIKLFLPGS